MIRIIFTHGGWTEHLKINTSINKKKKEGKLTTASNIKSTIKHMMKGLNRSTRWDRSEEMAKMISEAKKAHFFPF